MAQPQIKSRKQHIRLWFEFYKLALDDPALQDNLAKVRPFYEPWGEVFCLAAEARSWAPT
jgi:hypothetical protein